MWADPRFDGLGYEHIVLVPGERRNRLHDHYAFALISSGKGIISCRGVQYQAQPGSAFLFGPDQLWTAIASTQAKWSYKTLYVSRALLHALAEQTELEDDLSRFYTGVNVFGAEASDAGQRLMTVLQANSSVLECVAALVGFTRMLLSNSDSRQTPGHEPLPVARVRSFLLEHSCEEIDTMHLANLGCLTPFHMIRVFHRSTGVPPHKYATLVRVRHAEQLLRAGVRIVEAADQAGFYDQSHLNRCFRRVLGVTPAQYQKAYFLRTRPRITGERVMAYRLRSGEKLWQLWERLRSDRAAPSF